MAILKIPFGKTADGTAVEEYRLENKSGASVSVLTWGGAIRSICVPDREGRLIDVVLGCDTMEAYGAQESYYGALIGRFANRIDGGRFMLEGKEYTMAVNNGANHHHGGNVGFDKRVWQAREMGERLELSLFSPDNEENYPGNLWVTVGYTWGEDNRLTIDFSARCDATTIVGLTSHPYFNLNGHDSGTVLRHMLEVHGSFFTPVRESLACTGEILSVAHTPLDFTRPKKIQEGMDDDFAQIRLCKGIDHNFVLDEGGIAARLVGEKTGITMEVTTDFPGLQVYSGNWLDESKEGKGGARYAPFSALAIEAQNFPCAPNFCHFPSPVLHPGEIYQKKTVYGFSVAGAREVQTIVKAGDIPNR